MLFHDYKPAVIACAKCGVGLCRDCMNEAVYTIEGKPICLNCSRAIAEGELNDAQSARVWSLVKCIFSGLFLGIGLIAYSSGADIMSVWIIAGVAGIPTAFKSSRRSREERIMDEIEDRYKRDMIDLMFGWLLRLLFKLVFIIALAPICAVFTFFNNLIKFVKSGKQIKEAEKTLAYTNQCLSGEPEPFNEQPEPFIEQPVQAQSQMETTPSSVPQASPSPQVAQGQQTFQSQQTVSAPRFSTSEEK
ncbi:MAG: hypothetical protein LUE99_13200 [Bacteroides sp.]|nr:hypothetical protein [Bacteroides sp.]